ncbi:MAG: alternate-type signal peptide protein [Microbacteriaceae bacterium]|jgi:alternate signal-mediated exported protein|nr:alternate-type signal peptide protein [Microbacteriaceae bacterium]
MNKLIKGSIAGAAGIALLLGGAGTLAFWNDDAIITGATITAGDLDVAPVASPAAGDGWKRGTTVIPNITGYKIVPGDVLTYTQSFDVTATGDNLKATAALSPTAITAATPGKAADDALATLLKSSAGFTVGGAATTVVAPKVGKQTIVVTTTITFPSATAAVDNAAKLGAVNLANFTVALTQTV